MTLCIGETDYIAVMGQLIGEDLELRRKFETACLHCGWLVGPIEGPITLNPGQFLIAGILTHRAEPAVH